MTREIVSAAKALSLAVPDHLAIGRGGHVSFKSLGLRYKSFLSPIRPTR
jgi:DNA repair protein RadC